MNINRETVKQWTHAHKKEIIIVAGAVVVVGGAVAVGYHCHQVGNLKMQIRIRDEMIKEQAQNLVKMKAEHHELCMQKDTAYRALMSDALRHGSSMGGEEMAAYKAYLKTVDAVA